MNQDLIKLKTIFIDKKVADSCQFLDNVILNLQVLKFSNDVIINLVSEYDLRVENYFKKIDEELKKDNKGYIRYLDESIKIFNINTDIAFVINKNIKDMIQYSNNILDCLSQMINCALMKSYNSKDKVDFGYITKILKNSKYNNLVNIKQIFNQINNDDEFKFLRKSNNRIKHIKDISTQIGFKLLNGESITNLDQFTKNNITFKKTNIKLKCNEIIKYIESVIDQVIEATKKDMVTIKHQYRYNLLKVWGQASNSELKFEDYDFFINYIEIKEKDISKIPKQIELIFAKVGKDNDIQIVNAKPNLILLDVNEKFIGHAIAQEENKDYIEYRKYDVCFDNKEKFNEIINNREKMNYYPYFSDGKIVFIGK
ncbi:hypothetical protein FDB42_11980 [Clostridium botulinum]|nr:hypothetical protein [Clostridium botulinum]